MTDKELDALAGRVTNALDAPEPSPLFWEHFPRRVRAAVDAAPPAGAVPWWRRHGLALAMSVALVAAVSSWSWMQYAGTAGTAAAPASAPGTAIAPDEDEYAGWLTVTSVAESAGVEGLREAGFGVTPGGADAAIETLNDAERATLFALLQAEIEGDDSGGL